MDNSLIIQGREANWPQDELAQVRGLLAAHPDLEPVSALAACAGSGTGAASLGQIKDMAARALLLKLEEQGVGGAACAPRIAIRPTGCGTKQIRLLQHPTDPITGSLSGLQPLQIQELSQQPEARPVFDSLLHQYHYLGYTSAVGQNVKYLVRDRQGQDHWPVSCLRRAAA